MTEGEGQLRAHRSGILLGLIPKPNAALVAADYERALELIKQRGWAKGTGEDDDGAVCVGGALAWALSERLGNTDFSVNLAKAARDMGLDGYVAVNLWNDEPERTLEEVVNGLEQGAKNLRNQGRS